MDFLTSHVSRMVQNLRHLHFRQVLVCMESHDYQFLHQAVFQARSVVRISNPWIGVLFSPSQREEVNSGYFTGKVAVGIHCLRNKPFFVLEITGLTRRSVVVKGGDAVGPFVGRHLPASADVARHQLVHSRPRGEAFSHADVLAVVNLYCV